MRLSQRAASVARNSSRSCNIAQALERLDGPLRAFRSDDAAGRINRRAHHSLFSGCGGPTGSHRQTCKSGAEALSDTLWVLWPPRTRRCPFPEQPGVECACRRRLSSSSPPLDCRALSGTLEPEDGPVMAERDEPIAQLATRIPKDLHRRLKLHCVTHEIAVQDFVTQAIEEKLGKKTRPKKGTA